MRYGEPVRARKERMGLNMAIGPSPNVAFEGGTWSQSKTNKMGNIRDEFKNSSPYMYILGKVKCHLLMCVILLTLEN